MNGASETQPILYRVDSGIAFITLNMASRANSLNPAVIKSFLDILADIDSVDSTDSQVRAILIQAKGDIFCNGMDFGAFTQIQSNATHTNTPNTNDRALSAIQAYSRLLHTLDSCPIPIVVVVRGAVRGGGVGIVSAADVVIATPAASFELSELLFGLAPFNVIPQLLLRLSPARIRYMALTAQPVTVHAAATYGLVDEVVEEAGLEKRLRQLCRQLSRIDPHMVAPLKAAVGSAGGHVSLTARESATTELMGYITSQRVRQALESFLGGETPQWYTKCKPQSVLE